MTATEYNGRMKQQQANSTSTHYLFHKNTENAA